MKNYIGIIKKITIPKEFKGYGDRLKEAMADAFLKQRTCIVIDAMHDTTSVIRSDELSKLLNVKEDFISEIAGRAEFDNHYIEGTNLAVYDIYVWERFIKFMAKPLEE